MKHFVYIYIYAYIKWYIHIPVSMFRSQQASQFKYKNEKFPKRRYQKTTTGWMMFLIQGIYRHCVWSTRTTGTCSCLKRTCSHLSDYQSLPTSQIPKKLVGYCILYYTLYPFLPIQKLWQLKLCGAQWNLRHRKKVIRISYKRLSPSNSPPHPSEILSLCGYNQVGPHARSTCTSRVQSAANVGTSSKPIWAFATCLALPSLPTKRSKKNTARPLR